MQDVILVAISVAAFAGCAGVRLALWWAGPRKAASQRIDAGVAYLQSLPPSTETVLPTRAPAVPAPVPAPLDVAETTVCAVHGDLETALR